MTYRNILYEVIGTNAKRTALITLNRPAQLNALNDALMEELSMALACADQAPDIGCIVLTGGDKAFAAGADILSMAGRGYPEVLSSDFIGRHWTALQRTRKPVIAAVSGFALGGGCELAMMCDIIIASDTARFGQPEIKLAVIPGAGGTQRLPRAIGKAKAMDLVLTGRTLAADEAERAGLVSRVAGATEYLAEALDAAERICQLSLPSVLMAKECVNQSFEGPLSSGLQFERRLFHSLFATKDQKEGMKAFMEKRLPTFSDD